MGAQSPGTVIHSARPWRVASPAICLSTPPPSSPHPRPFPLAAPFCPTFRSTRHVPGICARRHISSACARLAPSPAWAGTAGTAPCSPSPWRPSSWRDGSGSRPARGYFRPSSRHRLSSFTALSLHRLSSSWPFPDGSRARGKLQLACHGPGGSLGRQFDGMVYIVGRATSMLPALLERRGGLWAGTQRGRQSEAAEKWIIN